MLWATGPDGNRQPDGNQTTTARQPERQPDGNQNGDVTNWELIGRMVK